MPLSSLLGLRAFFKEDVGNVTVAHWRYGPQMGESSDDLNLTAVRSQVAYFVRGPHCLDSMWVSNSLLRFTAGFDPTRGSDPYCTVQVGLVRLWMVAAQLPQRGVP